MRSDATEGRESFFQKRPRRLHDSNICKKGLSSFSKAGKLRSCCVFVPFPTAAKPPQQRMMCKLHDLTCMRSGKSVVFFIKWHGATARAIFSTSAKSKSFFWMQKVARRHSESNIYDNGRKLKVVGLSRVILA